MTEESPGGGEELRAREIATEQRFVDRVYTQMEVSARSAKELAREGHARGKLGHEGGLVERDAMVFQAARRLAVLDAAHEGLVFGRLDLREELDREPRYIGRIGLRDEHRDTLLIDWRAPAAAVFYQATAATPEGVVRRRVLRSSGKKVSGVEDELLDDTVETDLPIIGEGALMAQLTRARDRSMHSIVATIQAEQDKAIRAPSRGVVTISGGPGTGKTVVALHRAAYLLYSDRRRYETGGVLVVGPSGVFMRYIERVLPSLGETAVALRSLGEVVDGLRAQRRDDPAAADVKGSARMAELMRRLARQGVPGAPTSFRLFYRDDVLLLGHKELAAVRRSLLNHGKRNRQLNRVPRALADALWRQVRSERGRERGYEEFLDELLSHDPFVDFALAWWPALDGPAVLAWLRDAEVLARVGEGVVSHADQAQLAKSWAGVEPGDWSVEDIALIDELRYALGDLPTEVEHGERPIVAPPEDGSGERVEVTTVSDRELAGRPSWRPPEHRIEDDGYAHVLIDEAQDLTPMQWRMVGRRGRTASWTIVGDPAQ
ncbi:MAG: AAA family ATPase, partial [Nocardioides sp.]|nr:AAA family ATPase [Nocardioides sp.]